MSSNNELYIGHEEGEFAVRCEACGRQFRAPTALAMLCVKCRRPVLSAIYRQVKSYQPVWLDCEGRQHCGVTKHAFDSRAPVRDGKKSQALLYRCSSCGHLRQYGDEEI
jgi:uncharacterized OB-fold protein